MLLEQGRQQANERQRQGDIRGSMWQNLANIAAQYGKNVQQQQIEAPIRAQEAQMRGLQIQNAQGELADRTAARAHDAAFRDLIVNGAPDEELVKADPERADKFIAGRDAVVKAKQTGYMDRQKILADTTLGLEAVPDNIRADAYTQKRKELIDNKIIAPADAPERFDPVWFASTLAHAKTLKAEPFTLKEGETRFGADNKPIASIAPKAPTATAEQDDQRYRGLVAAKSLNRPIAPEDAAWAQAYEKQKTLGVDLTAGMASNRQATAIAAQTAQQQRAQTFQEQQQGRKELTDKIELPYQTAASSAQTLRDTVALAKNGNMSAAALQNLETTMAAIRAQGLNRINTAEIGSTADAGSIWDRLQSKLGKVTAGQPVDPALQKDMQQFAGLLEKAAYKKYLEGQSSLTKRYSLTDEKPLPGPTIYARDPQGNLHSAPYGQPLPKGWKEE